MEREPVEYKIKLGRKKNTHRESPLFHPCQSFDNGQLEKFTDLVSRFEECKDGLASCSMQMIELRRVGQPVSKELLEEHFNFANMATQYIQLLLPDDFEQRIQLALVVAESCLDLEQTNDAIDHLFYACNIVQLAEHFENAELELSLKCLAERLLECQSVNAEQVQSIQMLLENSFPSKGV